MSERKILDCLSFTNFDIKYIYTSEFLKFSEGMINLDKVLSALIFWFFGIKAKEQKLELKLKFLNFPARLNRRVGSLASRQKNRNTNRS